MKLMTALLVLMFQTAVFAQSQNLDSLLGQYDGLNKNGAVTIDKVMMKEANLFEPAQYIYTISMEYDSSKGPGLYLHNEKMTIDEKNQTLTYSGENECDDPGCWYIDQLEIRILRKADGTAYVELYYSATVPTPEEEGQPTEAQGTKLFFKPKK